MIILYIVIVFAATFVGSVCGMGGGVIIKPLLDALSPYSTFQINLASSLCVLCMAISSLGKRVFGKAKFCIKTAVSASAGALIGGVFGEFIFDAVKSAAIHAAGDEFEFQMKIIQNSVLAVLMIAVLVYMSRKKPSGEYTQTNAKLLSVFLFCVILGVISTFLGIGGGPINVCVLCMVMKAGTKEVGIYSLFTVMFAQIAKYIKLAATGGLFSGRIFDADFGWIVLSLLAIVAVIGGILGAIVNKKFSAKTVTGLYFSVIVLVIVLNIYNIIVNVINA